MSHLPGFLPLLRSVLAVFLLWAGAQGTAHAQRSPFYEVAGSQVPGTPGSIIRQAPLRGSPWGSSAVRVVYRSTGLNGSAVPVSGVVVIPDKPPPPGGYPVIAWAHPTTGVDDRCAPSRFGAAMFGSIPGLADMVRRGFVVVATDYEGLGMPGVHPYLVGISAGRSVIDSVRAAASLTYVSGRYAVWGHSQGGHAALWTGEVAPDYAPELMLTGIATAAPATRLSDLFEDDLGTLAGKGLTAMTLWSWSQIYRTPIESVVLPHALADVAKIGRSCLAGFADLAISAGAVLKLNRSDFLIANPAQQSPWSTFMAANTPGQSRTRIAVPVFIAQGGRDEIVGHAVTERFASGLCNASIPLTYHAIAEVNHKNIDDRAVARAIAWMSDRIDGKPASTSCRSG